jgi:ATP-dependent DNA helicase RecQ
MANTDSEITFLKPREDDITINPIAKTIEQQHTLKHQQIESVLAYIENDATCRSQQLLSYFGEKTNSICGKCSVCIAKASRLGTKSNETIALQILRALQPQSLSSRQLILQIKCSEQDLLKQLSELIELKKIKITQTNTYAII